MTVSAQKSLLALAIGAAVFALSNAAAGQDRVAVLAFSGPNGASARAAVVRALEDRYEMVGLSEWQQTASRLRARGVAQRNLARVAKALSVKAIVMGGVHRSGRLWTVSVNAREGATGKVLGRKGRSIPSPNRAGAFAGALASGMIDAIERAGPAPGVNPDPTPTPPVTADPVEDPRSEHPPNQAVVDPVEDPVRPAESDPPGDPQYQDPQLDLGQQSTTSSNGSTPHGWLELGVEINGMSRDFSVPIDPACHVTGTRDTAEISSTFPEIGARFSLYPGGIFTDRWPSGIGVEFSYHHHLYLNIYNTRIHTQVEAEEYSVAAGLTYRVVFGTADRGATLWPRIGYGRYSFHLGDEGNDQVPPFTYDHIYLGLITHFPLATRYIGLEAGFHYLGVFNIGQLAVDAYNAGGEEPSTNGFQVQAHLSGQIWGGLRWRAGFELFGFISDHTGKGHGWGSSSCRTPECQQNDECKLEDGTPIYGGILTEENARDIVWRFGIYLSYRFGWDPGASSGNRRRREADDNDSGSSREDEGDSRVEEQEEVDEVDEIDEVDEDGWW